MSLKTHKLAASAACLAMLCLAGCSDVVYRDRMASGWEFGPIRAGEWVQTKTVKGVLVRREHRGGFELGPLFIGHTSVDYSRTKNAAGEMQSQGAKP